MCKWILREFNIFATRLVISFNRTKDKALLNLEISEDIQ